MSTKKTAINFKELISEGTTFEVEPVDIIDDDSENEVTKEDYQNELVNHANFNCLGEFEDDEVYDSTEPFGVIAKKMTDLLLDDLEPGLIKKKVIRKGYGEKPQEKSIVKIQYNAYTEYNEEPFDCTYARRKPHQFVVGNGEVIPGLDYAVKSMQLNEKAQFLMKPELAYGKMGCMDRVPGNSTVLFEVELLECIEGGVDNYENLPPEEKSSFNNVYKFCTAQCVKAKDLFNRNIKSAIKEYNIAVSALEHAQLQEYDEQVKQQELLLKLYTNLLVCYTKVEEPKRGCSNFNKINDMTRGTDMKVPAKVYYNNAKCLRMLGDYDLAKKRLRTAYNLEPKNPDILNEFKVIDDAQKKAKEKDRIMASAFVGPQ